MTSLNSVELQPTAALLSDCGAVQRTAPQGSPRTPATRIAATTPGLIVRILNSVFFKFLNYSVNLTRYRPTPC